MTSYQTSRSNYGLRVERCRWSQRTGHLLGTLSAEQNGEVKVSIEVNISNPDFFVLERQLNSALGETEYRVGLTLGPWFANITEAERQLTVPVDLSTLPRPTASRVSMVQECFFQAVELFLNRLRGALGSVELFADGCLSRLPNAQH